MLLTKEVEVKLGSRNIKYYEDLGYEIPRTVGSNGNLVVLRGTTITVRVEDLQPYCKVVVDVLCDNCKEHISHIQYGTYIECSKEGVYFCNRCSDIKRKQTCMERYGVTNVFQSPEVKAKSKNTSMNRYGVEYATHTAAAKEKRRQTCLDRYGVEHPSQLPEIAEKVRKTNLERYGVEYASQSAEFKEQSRQTCLEKYGTEYFFQSDEFKEKAAQTCIEKYGEDMYSKTDSCKNKIKQTILDRYGVEYITQLPEIKNKIKEGNLQKYGVDCPMKLPEIQEKARQTNMLRYGFEYSSQSPEVKAKAIQTSLSKYGTEWPIMSDEVRARAMKSFYLHGTQVVSSQQYYIYDVLMNHYGEDCVKLNYPCGRCSLDIVVLFDDININIEYDGAFWHTDLNKDRRRDEFVKTQGYRILRIKSNHLTPNFTDLVDKIESLRNGEHTYDEMILPDWKTIQNDYKDNQ